MPLIWRKAGDIVRRTLELSRTTAGGVLFAAAMVLVAIGAVLTGNNLLFLLVAAMVSTLMVSNLISRLSLAGLELDFRMPEHVSARRKFPARILVRNSKRWMPSFSIRLAGIGDSVFSSLYFPVLPGGKELSQTVEVEFRRRGVHREDGFQFSTAFPFGFLERRAQVSLRREILVYPCMNPRPDLDDLVSVMSGEAAAHYRGRGHDFYRIRPYELFESSRHVDWKATARTGALQVREFAREQEPLVEILFDIDAPAGRQAWFEHAVDCCAYLVWHLTLREARVRFLTQEMATTVPATGDVYTVLKYLALVSPGSQHPPPGPSEEHSFHVVITADPRRYAETAWSLAHFVSPEPSHDIVSREWRRTS
ncbi:MAG: DUF58 domain-containing protein [Bryobacteraceae bacterium]